MGVETAGISITENAFTKANANARNNDDFEYNIYKFFKMPKTLIMIFL